ncbi:MAG: septal ring lytic transglycosylase RlpA family protein [Hyphomicrobiaceae bacterium]|nr:septal ring lytic transglycosylase RlpA family protein [Hyphomicrobiaceae bacterium]
MVHMLARRAAAGTSACARPRVGARDAWCVLALVFGYIVIVPHLAEAKTPGATYCFYKKCHRVASIAETEALVGRDIELVASHYDDCKRDRYNPCGLTSSGEAFAPGRPDNAASPIYPDGTILLVWSEQTKAAVVVRINNAGPYWGNRTLDVSKAAATRLGFAHRGIARLQTRILQAPDRREAGYIRNRRYPPVPGYIGRHESIAKAETAAATGIALAALTGSLLGPTLTTTRSASEQTTGPDAAALALSAESRAVETMPARRLALAAAPHTVREVPLSRLNRAGGASQQADTDSHASPDIPLVQASAEAQAGLGFDRQGRTDGAVHLIRTAEVGQSSDRSWQELMSTHLRSDRLTAAAGFVPADAPGPWPNDPATPIPHVGPAPTPFGRLG